MSEIEKENEELISKLVLRVLKLKNIGTGGSKSNFILTSNKRV
jgi:hypothetical protein